MRTCARYKLACALSRRRLSAHQASCVCVCVVDAIARTQSHKQIVSRTCLNSKLHACAIAQLRFDKIPHSQTSCCSRHRAMQLALVHTARLTVLQTVMDINLTQHASTQLIGVFCVCSVTEHVWTWHRLGTLGPGAPQLATGPGAIEFIRH